VFDFVRSARARFLKTCLPPRVSIQTDCWSWPSRLRWLVENVKPTTSLPPPRGSARTHTHSRRRGGRQTTTLTLHVHVHVHVHALSRASTHMQLCRCRCSALLLLSAAFAHTRCCCCCISCPLHMSHTRVRELGLLTLSLSPKVGEMLHTHTTQHMGKGMEMGGKQLALTLSLPFLFCFHN